MNDTPHSDQGLMKNVILTSAEAAALSIAAVRAKRSQTKQMAHYIVQGLKAEGLLPLDTPEPAANGVVGENAD